MPTPLATPTPEPTKSPAPTATMVPAESSEPKCGENFILKYDECICDERQNFILRGGNCYPICGTEAASPDSICVCPDKYEKDDFGNCQPKCDKKTSDLIGDKCLPKPRKHEKRVINGDVVDYICEPGYEYDKNRVCQKKETMSKSKIIDQCYDNGKRFWFIIYDNGTKVCNEDGKIWDCPNESCREINKRNKNKL